MIIRNKIGTVFFILNINYIYISLRYIRDNDIIYLCTISLYFCNRSGIVVTKAAEREILSNFGGFLLVDDKFNL